jgi:hypothetical protein
MTTKEYFFASQASFFSVTVLRFTAKRGGDRRGVGRGKGCNGKGVVTGGGL